MNKIIIIVIVLLTITCTDRNWQNPYDAKVEPQAPSALSIQSISDTSLVLKWQDNSDIEQGYVIEKAVAETNSFTKIAEVSENTNSLLDTNVIPADNYIYRVKTKTYASLSKEKTIEAYGKILIIWSIKTFSEYSGVNAIDFCPNSILFAMGKDDGTIIIWDILNSTENNMIPDQAALVSAIAFDATGTILISGYKNGYIYYHDILTGNIIRFIKVADREIKDIIFRSSSNTFFVVTDAEIQERDLSTDQLVQTITGKYPAALNKNQNILSFTDMNNNSLKLINLETNTTVSTITNAHTNSIKQFRFRNLKDQLLSCGPYDNEIKVWDLRNAELLKTITYAENIEDFAITPNGRYLLVIGMSGATQILNLDNYEIVQEYYWPKTNIKLSKNGRLISGMSIGNSPDPFISTIIYEWTGE